MKVRGINRHPAPEPPIRQRPVMVLKLVNLCKSFGGHQILVNINMMADQGEIIGLIGPNGAGKSTLINMITGLYRPDSGSVLFSGQELVGLPQHRISRLGVSRTFQLVKLFPSLTALENVRAGALFSQGKKSTHPPLDPIECLELVGMKDRMESMINHLTFCDRRRVEVARAIAAGPQLLLLDEPLAGLNDSETQSMTEVIGKIREALGTTILWVEHKMEAIFSLCDRLVVLNFGRKLAEGTPREIAADKTVIDAYLGRRSVTCSK
jgi:branched-chain amino acid transport system ATP-binding protein